MRKKSCVWLVCVLLCIAAMGKAQVVTLENGFAITSLRSGIGLDKVYPYQVALGMQYADKGWFNLSSNIGYLRRGAQVELGSSYVDYDEQIIMKSKLHYITLNTTFDIKKTSRDGYTFFVGAGPRLDFNLKSTIEMYADYSGPSDFEPTKEKLDGIHTVLFGLKCVGGIRKDFGNMQLGLNIAYLPSFTKLAYKVHDRTFTFGLSLGYKLGAGKEKAETIRSVRRHK